MPGIPKSKGCRVCKQRKIKCDETWPSCRQCKQIRATCPGPTSLFKFIQHGPAPSKDDDLPLTSVALQQFTHPVTRNTKAPLSLRKVYYSNVDDQAANYGILQIGRPRGNPTTLADRTAARLVTSMDRDQQGITSVYMTYLPQLPKHLLQSPCLRDAVELFCSAWADFRRQTPQGELLAMPQYGKALRSLRRALMSSQANDTETLAAMVLLDRSNGMFDKSQRDFFHVDAIRQTFLRIGPPTLRNQLEIDVSNEVHGLLLRNGALNGENDFLTQQPWKEALDLCANPNNNSQTDEATQIFASEDKLAIHEYTMEILKLVPPFQQTCGAPYGDEAEAIMIPMRQRLQELSQAMQEMIQRSWKRIRAEPGLLGETYETDAIVGKTYSFRSIIVGGLYLAMVGTRMTLLRMLYHLSCLYEGPDDGIYTDLRDVCTQIWSFVPYLRSLESVVSVNMLSSIFGSYEVANAFEREYILNSILHIDRYLHRLPRDKDELDKLVTDDCNRLKGQVGSVIGVRETT